VETHGEDLRAEVQEKTDRDAWVEAVKRDHRTADLPDRERAMLDFVVKLTRTPSAVREPDVATLRRHGFDDAAIHDVVQIAGLFAYYNRLADGLGVDLECGQPGA